MGIWKGKVGLYEISIKNVLMVAVIALLSMGIVFTYCYAKKNITNNNVSSMNGGTHPPKYAKRYEFL